jgi:hypothetical protein
MADAPVVVASGVAELRERWHQGLRDSFAVRAVVDREALEEATAEMKPGVVVLDLALPGL